MKTRNSLLGPNLIMAALLLVVSVVAQERELRTFSVYGSVLGRGSEGAVGAATVSVFEDVSLIRDQFLAGMLVATSKTSADGKFDLRFQPMTRDFVLRIQSHEYSWAERSFTVGDVFMSGRQRIDFVLKKGICLRGQVDPSLSGSARATVSVYGAGLVASGLDGSLERRVSVDDDGFFEIMNLSPGGKAVVVDCAEMASSQLRVFLNKNRNLVELDSIKLQLGEVSRGVVVDDVTRQPISGARVFAIPEHRLPNVPRRSATTDEHGEFEIRGLTRHMVYRVQADADGYGAQDDLELPESGFPSEISLTRSPRLAGRVRDASSGEPVSDFTLFVHRVGEMTPSAVVFVSEADGSFSAYFPGDGPFTVSIAAVSHARWRSAEIVSEGGDVSLGIAELEVGTKLSGRVQFGVASPDETIRLDLVDSVPGDDGPVKTLGFLRSFEVSSLSTSVNKNREFSFSNVAVGSYRIFASSKSLGFVHVGDVVVSSAAMQVIPDLYIKGN